MSDGLPTFFFPCTSSRGSVAPEGIIGFGFPGVLSIVDFRPATTTKFFVCVGECTVVMEETAGCLLEDVSYRVIERGEIVQ